MTHQRQVIDNFLAPHKRAGQQRQAPAGLWRRRRAAGRGAPVRLLGEPAAEHGRVGRQVVDAVDVRQAQPLLARVVVVHALRGRAVSFSRRGPLLVTCCTSGRTQHELRCCGRALRCVQPPSEGAARLLSRGERFATPPLDWRAREQQRALAARKACRPGSRRAAAALGQAVSAATAAPSARASAEQAVQHRPRPAHAAARTGVNVRCPPRPRRSGLAAAGRRERTAPSASCPTWSRLRSADHRPRPRPPGAAVGYSPSASSER